ncbi:HAD superfamily hydrolase (TIGR01484 family) [Trueperella bonasi]|uniref:HAD superfamily hydrolase (TIGR01484 family) n=1 Tax=Trueperella bonasi TaxID=312286 RepID=A0ABT9NFQ3_9ACTO|nr:HAD family hydrolase [Trueperella bonasi]MDP9805683.1 HAD superfamily hydrolase (TIGR01484 family) [Trueperella bonasi]
MNTKPEIDFANLPWPVGTITHAIFDIDGTLTDESSLVSDATIAALRHLDAAGVPITLATGRILHGGANLVERAGIHAWVIAAGGGVVWNGKDIVSTHYMEREQYDAVSQLAARTGLVPFYFDELDFYADLEALAATGTLEVNENASEGRGMRPLEDLDTTKLTKISLAAQDPAQVAELLPEIVEQFPGTVQSHANFVDIPVTGVTKWEGIEKALAVRGLKPETAMGVGDSDNDIAWLKEIGYPIAAPIASAGVLHVCRWQLPKVEDSVARLIEAKLARDNDGDI